MKKRLLVIVLLACTGLMVQDVEATYYEDVLSIVFNNDLGNADIIYNIQPNSN